MQNKNWDKIEKKFDENFNVRVVCNSKDEVYGFTIMKDKNGNCVSCCNNDIKNFFKKQFQNQCQEFKDIVESKINDRNVSSYYTCQKILKELNK